MTSLPKTIAHRQQRTFSRSRIPDSSSATI
nr:MAG TPA: hypothetical protein [Caudoviricetes sp.]